LVNNLFWVEGIGAIRGTNRLILESTVQLKDDPLEDNGLFGSVYFEVPNVSGQAQAHLVACFYENNRQLLGVNGNPVCSDAFIGTTALQNTAQIRLAPNPFRQQTSLSIESPTNYSSYRVQVYTTTGQLVQQVQSSAPTLILSAEQLPAGLYFYQIYGDAALLATGKMTVE
jgi:hypothetical protein